MKTRLSQSKKAGLILPISRFQKKLKNLPRSGKRVSKLAGVYTTAVIEYLLAETLELSGNACRDNRLSRITPRHIMFAIYNDSELFGLLKNTIIPGAGVLPKVVNDGSAPFGAVIAPQNPPTVSRTKKAKQLKQAPIISISPLKPALVKTPSQLKDSKGNEVKILNEKALNSGQKILVVKADITDVVVDAIVHPTNTTFYLGGQVGSAIARRGGYKIQNIMNEMQRTKGHLSTCSAEIGDASDNMLCKHIIHVHSPVWNSSNSLDCINQLTKSVNNILELATKNNINTVALPSISSGGNGFPKQAAAQTILRAINAYFKNLSEKKINEAQPHQVYFVLYDPESVSIYTSELSKLDINA